MKNQNELIEIESGKFTFNGQLIIANEQFVGINPKVSPPIKFYRLPLESDDVQQMQFKLGCEEFIVKFTRIFRDSPTIYGTNIEIFKDDELFYSNKFAKVRHEKFSRYWVTLGDGQFTPKYFFSNGKAYFVTLGFDSLKWGDSKFANKRIDCKAYYFVSFDHFVVPTIYRRKPALNLNAYRYRFFKVFELEKYRKVMWRAKLVMEDGRIMTFSNSAVKGFAQSYFMSLNELPFRTAERIKYEVSDGETRYEVRMFSPNEVLRNFKVTLNRKVLWMKKNLIDI